MTRYLKLFYFLLWMGTSLAQHTFSIVAVDSVTGEIGSAGATCGDSIIWPGTPGALVISDIIPGVGAIHTQSYYVRGNQLNAHDRMQLGDSPDEIIDWLVDNDAFRDPTFRQYGVVDYNDGQPRSAAYTGINCLDYKDHILGVNYSIQGNILIGEQVLIGMEAGFNNTDACLAEKLMAAMQGAKIIGADMRCLEEKTSSLSAFLRVAQPSDDPDELFLDLNIAGTPDEVEPIDQLQIKYDTWKSKNNYNCSPSTAVSDLNKKTLNKITVYPNPVKDFAHLQFQGISVDRIVIISPKGEQITSKAVSGVEEITISIENYSDGIYIFRCYNQGEMLAAMKVVFAKIPQ